MNLNRRSLNTQFRLVAVIIAMFLVGGWILSNQYVNQVISENTKSQVLRDLVYSDIAQLRNTLWQADNLLNTLMLSPDTDLRKELEENLKISQALVKKLNGKQYHLNENLIKITQDLEEDYQQLNKNVKILLEKSKDPYWVYPMLPFIDSTLLESNQEFETASTIALQEIEGSNGSKMIELYKLVSAIRDTWRMKILNFRAVVIRYVGLNTEHIAAQEKNIEFIHADIEAKLARLGQYANNNELGFETENSLEIMQLRSSKWMTDFHRLIELRKSNKWRADIDFVKTHVAPEQNHMFVDLSLLENEISTWSSTNTQQLEKAAQDINKVFGVLAIISIALIALSYVLLRRSVLKPIRRISDSIAMDSTVFEVAPSKFDSLEISILLNAFKVMKGQIHNRQRALEYQALHDTLTSLPNRALLEDRLKHAISISSRRNESVIVMLLDLNRFKEINDTLGHSVGDAVLKITAERLESCLRDSDTVARLGGDEFAIIMNSDISEARILIQRITQLIEEDMLVGGQHLYVSASIGVAIYPEHGNDVGILMQHADIAMYESKRGKKPYSIYSEVLDSNSIDNLALLGALRAEIYKPTDQFDLHYQPQINVLNNKVVGAEALLRWEHPVLGIIPPEQIIRMAEQTGLISELTIWIMEQAIRHCSEWSRLGFNMHVAVNLSAWNIQDPKLPETLHKLVEKYDIDPSLIELEITESTVMNDPVRAREVLYEISKMGLGVIIDDFGTGFSSLSYLKLLPVNGLKIDKSFVIDMFNDENDRIIVQSTIDLAHNLGLSVVAEGVEEKDALNILREYRCDFAQGYYFSRPLTSDGLIDWLKGREASLTEKTN